MAELIEKKLDGATLIEVLIAMVIIMAVFSIAIAVFSNVLSSGVSIRQIHANTEMEKLRLKVLTNTLYEPQHLMIDSIDYEVISSGSKYPGTMLIEISAFDHSSPAGKIKFLKLTNNEQRKD